jgi:hypothetical protein
MSGKRTKAVVSGTVIVSVPRRENNSVTPQTGATMVAISKLAGQDSPAENRRLQKRAVPATTIIAAVPSYVLARSTKRLTT